MKLKAFTSYLMVQILPGFCFNLDKLNLANSKITSIEHITMNPTAEQYMEYYADYDFPSEDYDHIGDIGDLDLIFPTLGRDELNLSIGPMALSVAEVGDFTRDYGTYIGDIKVSSSLSASCQSVTVSTFSPSVSLAPDPRPRLHSGQKSSLHQKVQLRWRRLSGGIFLGKKFNYIYI